MPETNGRIPILHEDIRDVRQDIASLRSHVDNRLDRYEEKTDAQFAEQNTRIGHLEDLHIRSAGKRDLLTDGRAFVLFVVAVMSATLGVLAWAATL